MTHPLLDDLKSIGYEELERRRTEIMNRLQRLRSWNHTTSEMWNQLHLILEALDFERNERLLQQDKSLDDSNNVMVNTDPLEEELENLNKKKRVTGKQYTVL